MASASVTAVVTSSVNSTLLAAAPNLKRNAQGQLPSSFTGSSFTGSSIYLQLLKPAIPSAKTKRVLAVTARTAGAAKQYEIEVDKPLGLTLGQKPGGGVVVTAVANGGNAAKAGIKAGDQVLYTSSFFGDELWPADKLGFTKTAVNAKPDSVYFVLTRGLSDVDVKKLTKRPAPPRFGRKLTESQKARASHICLDCGYIYTLNKAFEDQPEDFKCPQCQAPKKRFAGYDPETGKTTGEGGAPISVLLGVLVGAAAVGALALFGLQ